MGRIRLAGQGFSGSFGEDAMGTLLAIRGLARELHEEFCREIGP
jgi:hypothetical protein